MTSVPERPRAPRAAPRLAYAGVWLLLGCVYVALFTANGVPLAGALRGTLAAILPNALLGRVSLALARRGASAPGGRGRPLGRLALAVVGVAAVATAGWLALVVLDRARRPISALAAR